MGVVLIDRSEAKIAALKAQVANGLNNAAQYLASQAAANANRATGFMAEHCIQSESEVATPQNLSTVARSLAPYSLFQDTGKNGNLFFTRAWLATREKFKQFILGEIKVGTVRPGVVRAAMQEFQHNVTGRGLVVTKIPAFGGGHAMRGPGGRFGGSYGGKR